MILDLNKIKVLHTKMFKEKNIEFAIHSYSILALLTENHLAKAHSNVAYWLAV